MKTISDFFSSEQFMPHGHCYYWSGGLIGLHAISDALVVLAYYSIPFTLLYFVRQRRDIEFHWMFVCFAVFIMACGTTHLMEIWNIWHAAYWVSGGIKALTALASLPTAFMLIRLVPQALALPSAAQLSAVNVALQSEIAERGRAEARLRELNEKLEERVRERTAELDRSNSALQVSKELFAKAFMLSPDCLAIVRTADRSLLMANDALCRLWGCTPDDIVGKTVREYVNWLTEEERIAFMQTLEKKGECLDYETTLRLADGRLVPFSLSSRAITLNGESCILSIMRDITERRRAEEASQKINAIVESSEDAIIGKDLNGVVTSWNPGAEKIFGYTEEEMLGASITRIIPADRQAEEDHILARIKEGEAMRHFETLRVTKTGRIVDISVSVAPIRDAHGRVVGVSKIARNITDQKRAEGELTASTKEVTDLKTALDEHGIVAITDPRGKITFVNDKFCAISKYSRQELLGQDHRIINSGFHPKEFIRELWTTIAQGRVWHGEIKNKAKDGTFYWVDTTIVPFLDEHGKPRQYVAIRADITERKRVEEALAAERTLLRTLIDLLPDSVYVKDKQSRFLACNDACARFIGASTATELIGKTDADFHPIELSSRFRATELRILEGGSLINKEDAFVGPDGVRRVLLTTKVPLRDSRGAIIGVVGTGRDITESKRTEEWIRRLNTELEQRIIERTAQLEAANKELEAFSYSVSHDLRSPLRALDGFSQALVEDCGATLSPDGLHYLKTIRESAQRMGALIDDLLAFSRLSRQSLRKQLVNFDDLVRSALEALQEEQKNRQIELKIGALEPAEGDPTLLKQVWLNLLSNALKYTSKRERAVIEIGCKDAEEGRVYFVRDNGSGFDMRYADKLFGVFQRLHRAEDFPGTGVGLAIVQRIVHRHGGAVWAEAEVDRGATFYFTLPFEIHS